MYPYFIEPWDSNVIAADAGLLRYAGAIDCNGCNAPLGMAHGQTFGRDCYRLQRRRKRRVFVIAFLHLRSKHPRCSDPGKYIDWREALIDEAQYAGILDRDVFVASVREIKATQYEHFFWIAPPSDGEGEAAW